MSARFRTMARTGSIRPITSIRESVFWPRFPRTWRPSTRCFVGAAASLFPLSLQRGCRSRERNPRRCDQERILLARETGNLRGRIPSIGYPYGDFPPASSVSANPPAPTASRYCLSNPRLISRTTRSSGMYYLGASPRVMSSGARYGGVGAPYAGRRRPW